MKKFMRALRRPSVPSTPSASPPQMPSDAEQEGSQDATLPVPPSPPPSPSRSRRRPMRNPLRAHRTVEEGSVVTSLTFQDDPPPPPASTARPPAAPILYDMDEEEVHPQSLHRFPSDSDTTLNAHGRDTIAPRQISFSRGDARETDARFPSHFSTLSASNLSASNSSIRHTPRPRHNSFTPDTVPDAKLHRFPVNAVSTRSRPLQEYGRSAGVPAVPPASTPPPQVPPVSAPPVRSPPRSKEADKRASMTFANGVHAPERQDDISVRRAPRRAKTAMPEVMDIRRQDEIAESPMGGITQVDESPFSARLTMHRSDSMTSVETTLYNAYIDALHDEARSRAGGLRTIVNLLRQCEGNAMVIEKAALAIACLCENDAASRDVLGQYSAVQMLIQCLSMRIPSKYDRAATVEMIVYAILCLLKDSPRNVRMFEMFDGAQKMGKAAASERFENCPVIATHVFKALSELKHHGVYTSEGSCVSRTVRYVVRAMALHEHRTNVQECGVDALRTLIGRAKQGSISSHVLRGCVEATATAFTMHKESREMQWQCLSMMCEMEDVRDGLFSVPLDVGTFFGAFQLVIEEAKQHGKRNLRIGRALTALIKRGIDVAVLNCWRNVQFKDAGVDHHGVETMLHALKLLEGDAKYMDKICTVLRTLLQSEEGMFRMNSVQSACAILEGIEAANVHAVQQFEQQKQQQHHRHVQHRQGQQHPQPHQEQPSVHMGQTVVSDAPALNIPRKSSLPTLT